MSGNYVQRGLPAIFDKYARAVCAIQYGADMVIELPAIYATSAANNYAKSAINILHSLQCIDYLSFGSETAQLDELVHASQILNSTSFNNLLKKTLKSGKSYNKAVLETLALFIPNAQEIYKSNNILAFEYLHALSETNISPLVIQRKHNDYNDLNIYKNFASASAIREKLINFEAIENLPMPPYVGFSSANLTDFDRFYDAVFYAAKAINQENLLQLCDLKEGIENYLIKKVNLASCYSSLNESLQTKRYSTGFLNRLLLNILLHKTVQLMQSATPFINVLALNADKKYLLSLIQKSNFPIITGGKSLNISNPALQFNIAADRLFYTFQANRSKRSYYSDYTRFVNR